LLDWCGQGDRAYRFSVGEFVVLASRADLKQLEAAATDLRGLTAKQVFGGAKNATSVNISIAVLPLAWHTDAQQIMKDARQQLLELQQAKGGGIYVETPHEKEKTGTPQQQDKLWLARIRTALEQNRFRLIYKSIVSLEGETSQFFDVLLRMLNEQGGEIPALEFIPVAERHGLMPTIDQWVIQQAIVSMTSQQPGEQQDFGLFVRVADASIDAADKLLPWLLKQVKGYPVRPESLILTFKEEGLLDHMAKAKPMVAGLRKLRMRVAISHFGATQQSLQLLEQMPVDFLRLDEGIMKSLSNPKSSERTSSMLRQAREKGARIIAKQVTDAQMMAMLWTLGVHFVEGDYVQNPAAAKSA
jgi:EAL domain-containing protein (putative c-di-GMP-specific phosphodiesterase class I)